MASRCLMMSFSPHPQTQTQTHHISPSIRKPSTISLSLSNFTTTSHSQSHPFKFTHLSSKAAHHVNLLRKRPVAMGTGSSGGPGPGPDPALTNDDLEPTKPSQRIFSGWEMASLWIGLVVGVPSYYLAGSLVDLGMAWWQGIGTVVAANLILLGPLILTGEPGTRYGISFPVLARSCFGIRGAHVPTLLRALVGCGWYGIETWIGGQALFLLLPGPLKASPLCVGLSRPVPWLATSPLELSCFLAFWLAQWAVVCKGMQGIKTLEKYSAPILIVLTCCLLAWAYANGGGLGLAHMGSLSSSRLTASEFWALFFPSLTANISFWATLALNIPDFTRYAKSQRAQITGQVGLPVFMGLFTFVGLAVTSSTRAVFGRVITSPTELLALIGGPVATLLGILGIGLATVTTNIAANVVAPANALVNLSPSTFTFRRGALVTALLGIAFQPWRLLSSSESFVYTWLVGYSALLGPIGGVLLVDYYLVKRMRLNVNDLYTSSPEGEYYYTGGFNLRALLALVAGILPVVPGFVNKLGFWKSVPEAFVTVYNNAWFFSFFVAGILYWVMAGLLAGRGAEGDVASSSYDALA